jgi:hypothetical protein
VAGLSSFLALVVAATLWLTLRDDAYVAPTPSAPTARIQPAPAAALLEELTTAVRSGDRDAAAALADEDDPDAQAALRALVDNAEVIGLRDVDLRYLDELGGLDAQGEWRAAATLRSRFGQVDTAAATVEVEVGFAVDGRDVTISSLGGEHGVTPVWLATPVQVRRTTDTLVVATADAARYYRLAVRAVVVVRRVVPSWDDPLVLEVPADARGLDAALESEPGTFANIAGVTTAVPGSPEDDVAVHVFVNPARLAESDRIGQQVVISHEAAHVALDATSTGAPVWLGEGLADYVALRDVGLPLSVTAADLIQQARREGVPAALPGDAEFDEESQYFGAAYEGAWLACRMLARRVGEDALVRFYADVDDAVDFEAEFRSTFGLSVPAFTRSWRRDLARLVG